MKYLPGWLITLAIAIVVIIVLAIVISALGGFALNIGHFHVGVTH